MEYLTDMTGVILMDVTDVVVLHNYMYCRDFPGIMLLSCLWGYLTDITGIYLTHVTDVTLHQNNVISHIFNIIMV